MRNNSITFAALAKNLLSTEKGIIDFKIVEKEEIFINEDDGWNYVIALVCICDSYSLFVGYWGGESCSFILDNPTDTTFTINEIAKHIQSFLICNGEDIDPKINVDEENRCQIYISKNQDTTLEEIFKKPFAD